MSDPYDTAAARLLADLDPVSYPERVREAARRAGELAASGELGAVTAELNAGGPYERSVCALLACAGRDADRVASHLADPDPFVRGHALRAAQGLDVPDAAFEAALRDASEAVRRGILGFLSAGRRPALADRLVDEVRAAWGDVEAARLLPGCSEGVVARLLPEVLHAVRGWRSLVRRHPGVLLDVAERSAAAVPANARGGWFQRYAPMLVAVAPAEPSRVLDLLDACPPARFPGQLAPCVGVLAKAAPERVLRMYTGPWRASLPGPRRLNTAALRALARSGAPELDDYARALAEDPDDLAALLRAQAPAERRTTYETAMAGRGTAHEGVHTALLDALPRRSVAAVARRAADAARGHGADWATVLRAESYLPPGEAREALRAATRRPLADDRAVAWPLLVRNVARAADAGQLTELVADLAERLRNEQDPVRGAALCALADDVRPAFWSTDALPHLGRLVTDAVQARDRSSSTGGALYRLAVNVLCEHAGRPERAGVDWALDVLAALYDHYRGDHLGRFGSRLRRGQEHQVYEAVRPRIAAEAEKNDYRLALALARGAEHRAAGMTELQEWLRRAVEHGDDDTAQEAIRLWLEPRATRDERVAHVLDLEPSAVRLPWVAGVVAYRRTDLLDRFLADEPPYGRFLTAKSAWAFPVGGAAAVRRWLPRQQRSYVRQLRCIVDDAGLRYWRRVDAIRSAADVPEGGRALAQEWAESSDVTLAEAALGVLGRSGDDLASLLGHAGGDRARVAVYAAAQASRHVAPSQLAPMLTELLTAPGKKVTSRKEGVRLAALRLPAPQAARLLARAYAAEDTHRDVRATCVAFAAQELLAEEPAWEILTDAASPGREAVLRNAALRRAPLYVAPAHRARYAELVAAVADTDDDELAATALAALGGWAVWSPRAPQVFARALGDVPRGAPQLWHHAAEGLVKEAARTPEGTGVLCAALTALMGHGPEPDAGDEQDRPAHRRVEYVARLLADRAPHDPTLRPAARTVAQLLAERDAFVPSAAQVLLGALDPAAPEPALRELALLHADRPALAARTADSLRARLRREEVLPEGLDRVARALREADAHTEGLFAWAITVAAGERSAWPAPWRAELAALRGHPCPDVRDAAVRVATA
ncbi:MULTISPECIES: hypothetical protein [unclassified Streptomyces]|uniref:hypothetical protein n=1 Tax=unclassified Streptomyces TaxID=2593676 RepID=UPI00278C4FCE|nr:MULTISPECIES: hypothetical protein [unclassified Streptomyces]